MGGVDGECLCYWSSRVDIGVTWAVDENILFTNLCAGIFHSSLEEIVILMLSPDTIYLPKACHVGNIINIDSPDNDITPNTYSYA